MKSLAKKTFIVQSQSRAFASSVTIKLPKFDLHRLDENIIPKEATATKEELITYF